MVLTGAVVALAMVLAMASAHASAVQQQDDSLHSTSECDDARSRATATKLFEFVERQFDPYRNAQPLEVKVVQEEWEDDHPPSFVHHAKFAAFEAAYYVLPGGKRSLLALSTRSASFKLPAGIQIGQSKRQVLHALGPPTAISSKSLLYQIGGEAIHDVFFNFEYDRLAEVSWAYGMPD